VKRALLAALAASATVAAVAGDAHAYPQFQVGKEQACAACHITPSGGGLLDGMGPVTAEDDATFGGNPAFLHGAVDLPEWLFLGGDVRGAAGYSNNGDGKPAAFPMQVEAYGAFRSGKITGYLTLGAAVPNEEEPINTLLLREHWVMYRTSENADPGFYVRAGRFMPVYGLRQAEHPIYTRRYGGTPLYGETYGVTFGYLSPGFEVHASAFMRDRLRSDFALEKGDGGAVYAEKRVTETASVGVEWRFAKSEEEWRAQGGFTGKLWLAGIKTQLSAEAQIVHQKFEVAGSSARNQLVGYLFASWQGKKGFMVDLGIGHYDEDLSIEKLDRDCVDLNIHWFALSHLELVLMNRFQLVGLGDGGDNSYFSLLQAHYRL
jgi:hypothetical protein